MRAFSAIASVLLLAGVLLVSGAPFGAVPPPVLHPAMGAEQGWGSGAEPRAALPARTGPLAPTASTPSAPTNVLLYPHDAAVNVTWGPPSSNGGSSLTGYIVVWSPVGTTTGSANLGASTLHTWVGGLQNGVIYTFQVAAKNALGTGTYSSPISTTPGAVPTSPQNVTGTAGNGTATFAWSPSPDPAGYPVLGYTLNLTQGPLNSTYLNVTSPFTVMGLTDGLYYRGTVRAFNALGSSPPSLGAGVTPLGVPSAPTILSATFDPNHRSIQIFWSAPSWTGGASVDNYTILWQSTSGLSGVAHVAPTDSNWTLDNVQYGATYVFQLEASNRAGPSADSTASVVVPASSSGGSTAPTLVLIELIVLVVAIFLLLTVGARIVRYRRRYRPPKGVVLPPPRGSSRSSSPSAGPGGPRAPPRAPTTRGGANPERPGPRPPSGPSVWPPPGG